jgi:hypothetical protein
MDEEQAERRKEGSLNKTLLALAVLASFTGLCAQGHKDPYHNWRPLVFKVD